MTRRLLLLCLVLLDSGRLQACTVPVFRYALDRWASDNYRLEVSPMDATDPGIARFLRNFGANSPLNLDAKRLPPQTAEPSKLYAPGAESPLWEGALDDATLAAWTESPPAVEISRRILSGDAAVWILAESGDPTADGAVAARLEKRLRYLEQVAQLPAIDPNDPDSQVGPGPPLAVRFSLLRLPTGTTAFRRLLAGEEKELATAKEPWVAAVYGRGRVLGAWPAPAVGEEQIEQVCLFLLGACSCRVKNLNPGWDLLLPVDWDAQLQAMSQPNPAPKTPAVPETVQISGRITRPPQAPRAWVRTAAICSVLAGLLLAGVPLWRQFLSRPR